MRRFEWIPASACTRSVWSSATPRADPWAMPVRLSVRESYLGAECRGATQQGDEADEALGGTLVGIQERHVRRRRLVRPWARRRAHRLAAYRRCSTDVARVTVRDLPKQLTTKQSEELVVFTSFMQAAGLEAVSICQPPPPAPDIVCIISGRQRAFELVRLANPGFVQNVVELRRKANREGASVSPTMVGFADSTWTTVLPGKSSKTYSSPVPVELLVWLDPIRDPFTAETARLCSEDIRAFARDYPQFRRVWLFDPAHSRVLFGVEPNGIAR